MYNNLNGEPSFEGNKREELRKRVDRAQNYDELFELVKRIVEDELGVHRAGLTLLLVNMPITVGAYHPVGANIIVANRTLIDGIRNVTKDPREINAFVFMVLMHEYLHSLGYLDEIGVRKLAEKICKNSLGDDHPTVRLASANWLAMYPALGYLNKPQSQDIEVVRKFDSSSTQYIA